MQEEDKTYENEVTPIFNDDRGSLDLTRQIEELNIRVHILKLDKEIYGLKKDNAMIRETCQVDLLVKDQEIGRLMNKINELTKKGSI